ncbi:MAG: hypothetical protein CYG61_09290 [Actinobacteria bacterium]|nr:MAG: hypothetical protein CYG61_09290 [Actinomycetota bacterium]
MVRALVVVTGPPASGKSALAGPLADHLGFPLVAKDTVKEALFDALGTGDAAWSARLSDAAYEVMFALAPTLPEVVLEANFRPEHAPRLLALVGPKALEVHCLCPPEEQQRRWSARRRHPGHLDADHPTPPPPAAPGPLGLGPDVLEVDTTGEVDIVAVAAWARDHLPGVVAI